MTRVDFENWQKDMNIPEEFLIKECINKHIFDIYEFSQTKSSKKLINFFEELNEIGQTRDNKFQFGTGFPASFVIKIYKTELGNKVIFAKHNEGQYQRNHIVIVE